VIVEDAPVLDTVNTAVTFNSSTSATATVVPSCLLSAGAHSGVLTVRLCVDPACSREVQIKGNTIPYEFTVLPGLLVSASVDGFLQGIAAACTSNLIQITANVGQTVELTSTQPAVWSVGELTAAGFPCMSGATATSTTWSGQVSVRGTQSYYDCLVGGFDLVANPGAAGGVFNIKVCGLTSAVSPPACD
jgi:hypothetical protein